MVLEDEPGAGRPSRGVPRQPADGAQWPAAAEGLGDAVDRSASTRRHRVKDGVDRSARLVVPQLVAVGQQHFDEASHAGTRAGSSTPPLSAAYPLGGAFGAAHSCDDGRWSARLLHRATRRRPPGTVVQRLGTYAKFDGDDRAAQGGARLGDSATRTTHRSRLGSRGADINARVLQRSCAIIRRLRASQSASAQDPCELACCRALTGLDHTHMWPNSPRTICHEVIQLTPLATTAPIRPPLGHQSTGPSVV